MYGCYYGNEVSRNRRDGMNTIEPPIMYTHEYNYTVLYKSYSLIAIRVIVTNTDIQEICLDIISAAY